MGFLEDILLRQYQPTPEGASPFPNVPLTDQEEAEARTALTRAARARNGAYLQPNMNRDSILDVLPTGGVKLPVGLMQTLNAQPMLPGQGAGVQLAMDHAPAGTGVPPEAYEPPPSVPLAGPVPMPVARPVEADAPTDVGATRRVAAPPLPIVSPALTGGAGMLQPGAAPLAADGGMLNMPSILGGLRQKLSDNSSTLLALGAGFAGAPNIGQGISRAAAAAIPAQAADQKRILDAGSRYATDKALRDVGVPEAQIAAARGDPNIRKALVAKYFETKAPMVVNGRVLREEPGGNLRQLGNFPEDKTPSGFYRASDGVLRYEPGGPADPKYKREAGDRNNAPPGYRWINPENPDDGLRSIPGGPGEKVDAEVAGRLGLAKSFLGQLPEIRRRVQAGGITGPIDAGLGYMGAGEPGEIRRQIDSGAEALLRMLTGAGMSQTEAGNYVRRYQFSPTDTVDTVLSKLNQLERELNSVGESVGKGRGGWNPPKSDARPSSGKLANGVPWSVE